MTAAFRSEPWVRPESHHLHAHHAVDVSSGYRLPVRSMEVIRSWLARSEETRALMAALDRETVRVLARGPRVDMTAPVVAWGSSRGIQVGSVEDRERQRYRRAIVRARAVRADMTARHFTAKQALSAMGREVDLIWPT